MRSDLRVLMSMVVLDCRPAARPAGSSQGPAAFSERASRFDGSGVCDTVATLWRATGRAQVRLADTTMEVISDSVAQRGCAVQATAPQGLDSAQWASLYWANSAWVKENVRGWVTRMEYDADGPDGNSRTFERQSLRCQVDFSQDGGDDSDSTYVPSPAVGETTFCWLNAS